MLQVPRRTGSSGPKLFRLLARLADADASAPGRPLSGALSHWLGWTDAVALSTALGSHPLPVTSRVRGVPGGAEERECARVRAALADVITGDSVLAARRRGPARPSGQPDPTDAAADYATYRQRYLSLQQAMEIDIGKLRGRLRTALTARTPGMTRLAMVDTVMERVLGAREQSLLATVPALLEAHFERLRQAEETRLAAAQAAGEPVSVPPGAWLGEFRKDMQNVLLAELDLRFQPVEGLLAALDADHRAS